MILYELYTNYCHICDKQITILRSR